ncbi:MAG: HAD-IA family hydrolase [Sphingomicrobium sp.]
MSRLAIFDLDGTLVDSAALLERALTETFEEIGRTSPGRQHCRRVIGLSLLEAARALMPQADAGMIAEFAETFKSTFPQVRGRKVSPERLFEGIIKLVDGLRDDGWLLAIATGNTKRGIERPMKIYGLEERFISVQTADDHPSKPHPSMVFRAMGDAGASSSSTIVIGDTTSDVLMARAARASPIGASWGRHEAQDLVKGGAAAVARHPSDVLEIVRLGALESSPPIAA